MMMPERIGGPKPEEKKPALTVVAEIGRKMPSRIGGPSEDAGESESEPAEPMQSKDDATREILSAIESKSESRLKSALEAFVYACGEDDSSEEQPTGEEE